MPSRTDRIIKHDPNAGPDEEYSETCRYCTRKVFIHKQWVNEDGKAAPHDYPIKKYRGEIKHHGNHCPDIHANLKTETGKKTAMYYHELRISKGMGSPWKYPDSRIFPAYSTKNLDHVPDCHKMGEYNNMVQAYDKLQKEHIVTELKLKALYECLTVYSQTTRQAFEDFTIRVDNIKHNTSIEQFRKQGEDKLDNFT